MQEEGHNISGMKCTTKFQSLKRTYKCIMDHNKKSGNNRKDWEYLEVKLFKFFYSIIYVDG